MAKLADELQNYPGVNSSSSLVKCIKSYIGDEGGSRDE